MGQTFNSPGGDFGAANGTSPVTVIPAPGASTSRTPMFLNVFNADSANVVVSLQFVDSVGPTTITLATSGTIAPGGVFQFIASARDCLVTVNQSYQIVLAGAITTSQPLWKSGWADYS